MVRKSFDLTSRLHQSSVKQFKRKKRNGTIKSYGTRRISESVQIWELRLVYWFIGQIRGVSKYMYVYNRRAHTTPTRPISGGIAIIGETRKCEEEEDKRITTLYVLWSLYPVDFLILSESVLRHYYFLSTGSTTIKT